MPSFTWDHVHLRSPDPDAAARFYAEMFEARVANRVESGSSLRVTLDVGGQSVFIDRVPPGTALAPEPPYIGVEHIALAVRDLDQVAAALRRKGAVFVSDVHSPRPGLKIAFVRAPDGVQVELLERSPS